MKLIQILTNPLVQVISFCIILVGSPEFGEPFGFFIFHAAQEGYAFAIIGAIAIVLTLAPFIMTKISSYLQIGGSLLMVISFLLYMFSSTKVTVTSFVCCSILSIVSPKIISMSFSR